MDGMRSRGTSNNSHTNTMNNELKPELLNIDTNQSAASLTEQHLAALPDTPPDQNLLLTPLDSVREDTGDEITKREHTMESSNMDDFRKGSFGAVCDKCGTYHARDVANCQAFIKFNVTHNQY